MDLFSDLPGNGKGALGAPSDDEGGFSITAVVESTYGQYSPMEMLYHRDFWSQQGQMCSTWLVPKVSLLLDPAKK